MGIAARIGSLRSRLGKGGIQVNIVMLASGTAVGQAAVILASPLVTRLYSPADFGLFGVYFFMYSILLTVNSLRYEYAIPLAQDEEKALSLVGLAGALVVLTTVLFGALLWLFADPILSVANAVALKPYLWLLPAALLVGGFYQILDYWSSRTKQFSAVARARLTHSTGQVGAQIGLGALQAGTLGLLVGNLVGLGLAAFTLWRASRIRLSAIVPAHWPALLREYRNFPLYTAWGSLIDVVGFQMPTVLLSTFYAPDEAGYFAFTSRVLGTPAILLGQAVARVFYPEITSRQDDLDATRAFLEGMASFLFAISAPLFTFIMLYGPLLSGYAFGAEWEPAGLYARFLAPWFIIAFVSSPLSTFSLVKNKQKVALGFSVGTSVLRVGAIMLGVQFVSAQASVILFSAVSVVVYLAYFGWLLNLGGSSLLRWLGQNLPFILIVVALGIVFVLLMPLVQPLVGVVLSALGLGSTGLYFVVRHWRALNHV